MKKIFFVFFLLSASMYVNAQQNDYRLQAVDFTRVKLDDNFWLPRIETNRTVTIPASFARCESTGRIDNFIKAATHKGKFGTSFPFDDTDIYKTIEGASYSLALHPDAKLEAYVDSLVMIIKNAQEPDGYLYTARTIDPQHPHPWSGSERWVKERELSHELYNAGHLYEAAAAHYLATNEKKLLNIALKNADLVCSVFGPAANQRHTAPGHEIVEMGLVKLYRITGKKKYLSEAKYFIEERGRDVHYDAKSKDEWKNGAYWQDDKPVVDQDEAEGHAVRAGYLYAAMADVAALTGDKALLKAVDHIWENTVSKKMYITGSVGAVADGERFGDDYELPNATAYNETCAAIAQAFWNERMFLLHGDSKYIDVLEKVMYNGLISGEGLDGKSFFYSNAMQIVDGMNTHSHLEPERSGWFDCSCCPTNLVRFIPSVPGYIYAQNGDDIYVNLFISSTANLSVHKHSLQIVQQNNYPWDGGLLFVVNPSREDDFNLKIRIPGWARNEAMPSDLYQFFHKSVAKTTIKINGKDVVYHIEKGYAVLNKKWKKGDRIEVDLPMEVRMVVANQNVKDDCGKAALQRGPIVYCAEWADNNNRTSDIILPANTSFFTRYKSNLLKGVMTIDATIPKVAANDDKVEAEERPFVAIPYYSWANRGKGEMQVWFPEKIKNVALITKNKK